MTNSNEQYGRWRYVADVIGCAAGVFSCSSCTDMRRTLVRASQLTRVRSRLSRSGKREVADRGADAESGRMSRVSVMATAEGTRGLEGARWAGRCIARWLAVVKRGCRKVADARKISAQNFIRTSVKLVKPMPRCTHDVGPVGVSDL